MYNTVIIYVLGKEDTLRDHPEIYSDYSNFAKENDGDTGVFTVDTRVVLEVFYDSSKYKIIRTPKSHEVFSLDDEGHEVLTDFKRLDMISKKINLYMQKQIYEISKKQKNILELVDTFNSMEIAGINDEIKKYKSDILKINLDNIELRIETKKKKIIQLGIDDLKKKILKLGTGHIKNIFEKNNQETQNHKIILDDLKKFSEIPKQLQNLIDEISLPVDKLEISEELDQFREELLSKINGDIDLITKSIGNISGTITEYREKLNSSKWSEEYQKTVLEFNRLKDELSPDELEAMENLGLLHEELELKENQLKVILDKERKLKENDIEIERLVKKVDATLRKLTDARCGFCRKIFSDLEGINAQIQPNRDFSTYVEELRRVLGKEDSFETEFDNLLQKLSKNIYSYKEIYKDIEKIRSGEENKIFSDKKLSNVFMKLSNTQLSDIQVLTPNDLITITIELNGKKVSLSNASAGQKTSAILSMILAYGDSPLVLDQPEDDLDSQLINNLIVRSILKRKENRQIVIVTHNANIPVNGDSEWLICMGDQKDVNADLCGSVDEPTVKNRICTVMEGGEDAFNNRAVRYGFKQIMN